MDNSQTWNGKEEESANSGFIEDPSQAEAARKSAAEPQPFDVLSLKLSNTLHRKLLKKAIAEGVTIEEFAGELLAEGLVLRAWEIMERKSAMRGSSAPASYSQNGRVPNRQSFKNPNHAGVNRGRSNGAASSSNASSVNGGIDGGQQLNNGGMYPSANGSYWNNRNSNYKNIMEDNANFLEYVRSQEKKQR